MYNLQTSLAGRERILLPLKVTVIARNSDLFMKGHGCGGQRGSVKWCILCTKLEVASREQS